MSIFSHLFHNHIPWLKSPKDTFKFLIGLLKPGLYFNRLKWRDHGIFVSVNQGKIIFKFFRVQYVKQRISGCKIMIQETQKDLSSITHFLIEFLSEYMLHSNDTINVYHTNGYGYFFVNHVNKSLLWRFEDLYHIKEGKCTIDFAYGIFYHEVNYKITVQKDRVIDVEEWNDSGECERKLKLQPISLEAFFLNGDSIVDENGDTIVDETVYKLTLRISEDISINKKTCSCFLRELSIAKKHLPEMYDMLQINP